MVWEVYKIRGLYNKTKWLQKHMPLDKKIELVNQIHGFKEMSVCEDETAAYEYWKNNFNYNKKMIAVI